MRRPALVTAILAIAALPLSMLATTSAPAASLVDTAQNTSIIHWGKPAAIANFSSSGLNTKRWYAYNDPTPKPGHPRRTPSAVHVSHGQLQLVGHIDPKLGDVSGAIGDRYSQTYGRWEIRFRANRGRGYAPVVLLWPTDNKWPAEGEIDLAEVFDSTRQSAGEFLHYGADNHQSGRTIHADFTKWHTIAVDWLPDHITFYLDGKALRTVHRNADPAKNLIPSTPFRLALQNDQGCSGYCHRDHTTPKNVTMYVDWVKIYRLPPSAKTS